MTLLGLETPPLWMLQEVLVVEGSCVVWETSRTEKLSSKNWAEHSWGTVKNSCGTLCSKTLSGCLGDLSGTRHWRESLPWKALLGDSWKVLFLDLQEPLEDGETPCGTLGRLVRKSWDTDGWRASRTRRRHGHCVRFQWPTWPTLEKGSASNGGARATRNPPLRTLWRWGASCFWCCCSLGELSMELISKQWMIGDRHCRAVASAPKLTKKEGNDMTQKKKGKGTIILRKNEGTWEVHIFDWHKIAAYH